MPKFIEGKIECPFYLAEGNGFIKCEGVLANTECMHRFETNQKKMNHEEMICSVNGGRKCQHYRTVAALYDRGLKA